MSDFFMYKQNYFDELKNSSSRKNNQNCFGLESVNHRISSIEINDLNDEFDPFNGSTNHSQFKKFDFSKSAPSESQWLHGEINRYQAEEKLKYFGKPGCYLIRKSDRKSDRSSTFYVLSYLDKKGTINHFQITSSCGQFFIAGEKYASLKHLVGYYTKYADLLKNEKLIYPVPPNEKPIIKKTKCVAILPYTKITDTDELSFIKGDIFEVHNYQNDGWLWCTNLRTNETGLVYEKIVKVLNFSNDPNINYPWFLSSISKEEADDLLFKRGSGSFLVRPSDHSPGNYSLFFFVKNTVQRFRIERIREKYVMGNRFFDSLEDIINLYKNEQIVAGFKLGDPVTRFDSNSGTNNNLSISSANNFLPNTNMKSFFENGSFTSNSTGTLSSMSNNSSLICSSANDSLISSKNTSILGLQSFCDNSVINTDEIYASLSASREQSQKYKLEKQLTTYLLKKSQKTKKWKQFYFVLNPDLTLNLYYNDKKVRLKGVIDLNYSYLYVCHESLFDKPYCFQLVEKTLPCISTVHYICATNNETFQQWIQALKPLCSPKQLLQQQKPLNSLQREIGQYYQAECATQIRTLYLTLFEARRLPVKIAPHPFFLISLNKQKIGRTSVKCPPDPIYEEEFILEDIPGDITNFSISLFNKSKRSKDTEIAEFCVELSSLVSGEEVEEWFNLNSIMIPNKEDFGSLRLRIRFVNELIMPISEYQYFKKLLLDDGLEVISLLEDFCNKDRSLLANSLLKIFISERKEAQFLKKMIEREVKKEQETCTLFRSNSLTTNLMDKYMKEICPDFINKALKESINKIMENKHSCELNPQRLPRYEEACANAGHLLVLLDEVIERIFDSVEHCPTSLRYICNCLQKSVMAKWPNDKLIKTQAVGSFIFLRLICPAILYPRQFNLINEIPSETASRSLILIAKCLQNLSNLMEFGNKEAWMDVINPFIFKNKSRMVKFIDELSNVSEIIENNNKNREESARELAAIHTICETHREKISNLSQTCPTLKTLAEVTQLLTKQKKRYSEPISINLKKNFN